MTHSRSLEPAWRVAIPAVAREAVLFLAQVARKGWRRLNSSYVTPMS